MTDPSPWDTNSTLLSKLKRFDERSAWELVDGHFRTPLEALATRSGLDPVEAQDVVQETLVAFARAHRERGYDPGKGRLRSWLFGIASKQIARALRGRARRQRDEQAGVPEQSDEELEGVWQEEWERHALRRCLDRVQLEVHPRTYEIFLGLLSGESAAQVADRLGAAITVVYNAKSRVSKRIQELLREMEDE